LRDNLARNRVEDRAIVIHGAASDTNEPVRIGYGEITDASGQHVYIGNVLAPDGSRSVQTRGVTLRDAMDARGEGFAGQPFTWAKIDCESCEYAFLDSTAVRYLSFITGEVHAGWERLVALLDETHRVNGPGQDFGPFTAVLRRLDGKR
jgi:hypothetical protein